jgi:hypothetical protein
MFSPAIGERGAGKESIAPCADLCDASGQGLEPTGLGRLRANDTLAVTRPFLHERGDIKHGAPVQVRDQSFDCRFTMGQDLRYRGGMPLVTVRLASHTPNSSKSAGLSG